MKNNYFNILPQMADFITLESSTRMQSLSEANNKMFILYKIAVLLGKGRRLLVDIKLMEPTYLYIYS